MVDTSRSNLMDFTFPSVLMWGTQTAKLYAKCAALKIAGREEEKNTHTHTTTCYNLKLNIPSQHRLKNRSSVPVKKRYLRLYKSIPSIKSWHEGWSHFSPQRHRENVQNVTNVWWGIKDGWSQAQASCVFQSREAECSGAFPSFHIQHGATDGNALYIQSADNCTITIKQADR